MFYPQTNHLSMELFQNPPCQYRGTPFWAWNCKLEKDELLWQIEVLKQMGLGGFHMHSRSGMATTYLSDEFMDLVKACTEKAKQENMLAWLYDEDRWPSGSAGGLVTKNPAHRSKFIRFTVNTRTDCLPREEGIATGKPWHLVSYDITFDAQSRLISWKRIGHDDAAQGEKFNVYVETQAPSGWYNGQAYVDTLSEEAMQEFIRITYEGYKKAVGEDFGKTVPAIFTDEPQFMRKSVRAFSTDRGDLCLPFTADFLQTYEQAWGEDLLDHLPELFFERADGLYPRARYRYHDHVTERFARAFSDQCGAWCDANSIALTGHMMEEPTLLSQTSAVGETMRCYRGFAIPGIDMLNSHIELTTAKQCQSAVHQYGREAMMSELYGVTGWQFDFRGHKFHGDWQAALGVTVRVPHLSWVSMKGSAKRDYPASIHYQSPWWKEYPLIEDHFARVAAAMTRGKPDVRVGVIHPIESYWLTFGPQDLTASIRSEMESAFDAVTRCLLFGNIDFDFVCESILPELHKDTGNATFGVGAMAYDAIVVPQMLTMRSTTLSLLTEYQKRGGKLIFIGDAPTYIDAMPDHAADALYAASLHAPDASVKLLNLLESERELTVFNDRGEPANSFLYQMRKEGEMRYLFLSWGKEETYIDTAPVRSYRFVLHFPCIPTILDTKTGKERPISYEIKGGRTVFDLPLCFPESLLFRLAPVAEDAPAVFTLPAPARRKRVKEIFFKSAVPFKRTEDNVAVLDLAEWSVDGKHFNETEEILRIDDALRAIFAYPRADGHAEQPWVIPDLPAEHFPTLRFTFESEEEFKTSLALEEAVAVNLNGEDVDVNFNGYYVDKSIRRISLPKLKKGKNVLTVQMPITARISIENCFLLGDFDVELRGTELLLKAPRRSIGFGSIVSQGMPFYGGNLIYECKFTTDQAADLRIRITQYRGALMRLELDGADLGELIYAPYEKLADQVAPGEHTLKVCLYTNRVNAFGPLHNCETQNYYQDPGSWYTRGAKFSYEHKGKELGIMISPVVEVLV